MQLTRILPLLQVDKDTRKFYLAEQRKNRDKIEKRREKREFAKFAEELTKEEHPVYGLYFRHELEERHEEFVTEEVRRIHPFINKGKRKIKDQIRDLQAKASELAQVKASRGSGGGSKQRKPNHSSSTGQLPRI